MVLGSTPNYRQGPPRVNLLPREFSERWLVRRQRAGTGAAFAVLLALLALWYVLEARELADARRQADGEQAVAAGLRARKAQLQPFADLAAQVAAADQLRSQVYAKEVRFSTVLRDVSAIIPDNVWLTQMSASFKGTPDGTATGGAGTGAGTAPGTNASPEAGGITTLGSPGADSPIATITFEGSGLGHVDVGQLLRALARGPKKNGQPVYLNPYFTSAQKAEGTAEVTVTFSASVDMSTAAYSGRFQPAGQQGTVIP